MYHLFSKTDVVDDNLFINEQANDASDVPHAHAPLNHTFDF